MKTFIATHPAARALRNKLRVGTLLAIPFVCALVLLSSAHGQMVLQDSYAADSPSGAPTDLGGGIYGYEFTFDTDTEFSAAGHGKLIVGTTFHDGVANDGTQITVTKVIYDGVELNTAVAGIDNWQMTHAGIWYLDNVATDGTLRIELSGNLVGTTVGPGLGFSLYAVDGLKAGVQDTGSAQFPNPGPPAAAVTFTTAGGFFVQEAVRNNQAMEGQGGDYVEFYDYDAPAGGGNGYRGLGQYRLITAAGDYVATVGNTGVNTSRTVTAAFEAVEDPSPAADPRITSFTSVGVNLWELTLTGEADTGYEFYSSPTLDFTPGTLIENLTQGDPGDAGTIGGTNDSVLTSDSNGDAKVRIILNGVPADFVRAQSIPPPPPLLSEDFEAGDGGFTTENKGTGTNWEHGAPNSPSLGGGAVTQGNGGSTNAWGTNLTGAYVADTNACLRSGVIDLSGVSAAKLSFALSLDANTGHTYQVDVIETGSDTVIANVIPATEDGDLNDSAWATIGPVSIPAPAIGQQVRIQWTFVGNGDGTFNGAYIDDVLVESGSP